MAYVLGHLLGLATLGLIFTGTGVLCERLVPSLRRLPFSSWQRWAWAGITLWICLLFLLAAAQCLTVPITLGLAAAFVVTALLTTSNSFRLPGIRWTALRSRIWLLAAAAPACAVLVAVMLSAVRPMIGWDDDVYHLTIPKLYLAHGGFRAIPMSLFSNWPLNIELLFGLAMMVQDFILAKLTHFLFLVLLCALVYEYAAARGAQLAGIIAVSALLANPVLLEEADLAYVDIAYAFFFFAAFVCGNAYLESRDTVSLVGMATSCGIIAGIKLNGAFAAAVMVTLLWAAWIGHKRISTWREPVWSSAIVVVITIAMAVPWWVKSYWYAGNPFYPFAYGLFGGEYWSAGLTADFLDWQRSIGMGREPSDYLLLPLRVVLSGGDGYDRFDGELSILWLILVPILLTQLTRDAGVRRALGCAAVFFVLWAASSQQLRFLIPMLPLLAAASGRSLAQLIGYGSQSHARGRFKSMALTVAALLPVVGALLWAGREPARGAYSVLRTLIRDGGIDLGSAVPPPYRFANETLPADARIVLINLNRGFFLEREYLADSAFEASQLNELFWKDPTVTGVHGALRRRGITHLLLFTERNYGINYPPAFEQMLAERAVRLYRSADGAYLLYKLEP